MKPLDYPLLADENIHPDVVARLRAAGKDVGTVQEEGLRAATDLDVLRRAREQGRVVLTHDRDFGLLALYGGEPYVGIIYLRPGHISSNFVMEVIAAIEASAMDVEAPFIVVAERKGDIVRVRVRRAFG